jgi:hypothetical protein
MYDVLIAFYFFIGIMFRSAIINESFSLFKVILKHNKSIIDDLYKLRKIYFKDQNFKSENFIYNKAM